MTVRKPFNPITIFYHVTPPEHVEAIEREGLRAGADGVIYAFTDLIIADTIANSQVFVDPYALFVIQGNGITGELFADDVAELSHPLHCIIHQKRIGPQHLYYLGTMAVQKNTLTPWQWLIQARMGFSRRQIEKAYGLACQAGKVARS